MKIIAAGPLGPWIMAGARSPGRECARRRDIPRVAETRLPSGPHEKPRQTTYLADDEFPPPPFVQRRGEWAMKWTIAAVLLTAAAMSLAIALVDTSHLGGQAHLSSGHGAQGWAAMHTVQW